MWALARIGSLCISNYFNCTVMYVLPSLKIKIKTCLVSSPTPTPIPLKTRVLSRMHGTVHRHVQSQSTYICRVQSCVWHLPNIDPPPPSPPSECVFLEDARHWIGLLQYNLSTRSVMPRRGITSFPQFLPIFLGYKIKVEDSAREKGK